MVLKRKKLEQESAKKKKQKRKLLFTPMLGAVADEEDAGDESEKDVGEVVALCGQGFGGSTQLGSKDAGVKAISCIICNG